MLAGVRHVTLLPVGGRIPLEDRAAAARRPRLARRQRGAARRRIARGERESRPRGDDAYDCISYFNPTSAVEYERTVNAWAGALLVVVNQSTIEL